MYDFFNKCNVLCSNQNGYIKQRNTTRAIYQAITEVLSGVNDNESTFGIFMDLTKAFDSVDYAKLFEKLEIYGVRGRPLELIKSYLHKRKQAVMSEDKQTSEWLETERGVPQGSILGPLLFIIYVNDIPEVTPYAATLFADDTSVIIRSMKHEIENEVISTLNNFDEWFSQNNLKLNISKTKLMEFSYFKNEQRNIKYNDTELIITDAVTFLGLRIDSQLNWKNHINYLAGKVSSFVYALRVISTSVEVSAGRAAYFAYVHSRLKYGVIFWGSSVDVPRLFVLQKACVRSVFNLDYRESCKETFRVNGILTLTGIYIYECAVFVKENFSFFQGQELQHDHMTRGMNNSYLLLPQTKKTIISKSVISQTVRLYNHLPMHLKRMSNKHFKHNLKILLIDKAYYNIAEFLSSSHF